MLKEGTYSLSNFTLYYWIGEGDPNIMEGVSGIFKNETFMMSLVNSLKLTLVNGVFGTIFGQMLGYICAKGRGKLHGKLVEQLVFIPYLIPSVAFGGIYLSMFSKPQTLFGVTLIPALYGTCLSLIHISLFCVFGCGGRGSSAGDTGAGFTVDAVPGLFQQGDDCLLYTSSNYNRLPRPAVVMLTPDRIYEAVRRETFADLTGLDL